MACHVVPLHFLFLKKTFPVPFWGHVYQKEPKVAHHPTDSVKPKLAGCKTCRCVDEKANSIQNMTAEEIDHFSFDYLILFLMLVVLNAEAGAQQGAAAVWRCTAPCGRVHVCRSWSNDWLEHDMFSAALSPTPRAEDNHCALWSGVKEALLHFYWTSERTVASKVVIFSYAWVAAGGGLSHCGPAVNVKRRDGPCLWTQTRGRRAAVGAKVPCGHTFPASSRAAYSHDQNTRSSHANTVVTHLNM